MKTNPFQEALTEALNGAKYHQEQIGKAAQLAGWIATQYVPEEVMELIYSVSVYTDSAYINLKEEAKGSHIPISLARVFGSFEKIPAHDGKSVSLAASLGEDHPSGLRSVTITGYLPDTCKLVEERVPLSEDLKKQYLDMIENGAIKFKTECAPESEEVANVAGS